MAETNILTATFEEGSKKTLTDSLWQWNYGQILRIEGLTGLPTVTEVHFAQSGASLTKLGTTADDVCSVEIPNAMLRRMSQITAYIYLHAGEDDGETVYEIAIPVKGRAQPESYDEDDPETQREYDALVQATELLNSIIGRPLYPSDGLQL